MTNSKKNVKSRGVLLFAFNSTIDYVKIAKQCARLVKTNLKLPVTLVTDDPTASEWCENVILVTNDVENYKSALDLSSWKNFDRYRAYELSPYDETLLIDTDYLVLDDSLLKLFGMDYDYHIMESNNTIDESWDFNMGQLGLPYLWATVILFKKTPRANLLFDLVGKIQRNYGYYCKLYNVREGNFRNDYAFTIANLILNGYTSDAATTIPLPMLTLDKPITNLAMKYHFIIVREESRATLVALQNVHIMDKNYLLTDDFQRFVDNICQE